MIDHIGVECGLMQYITNRLADLGAGISVRNVQLMIESLQLVGLARQAEEIRVEIQDLCRQLFRRVTVGIDTDEYKPGRLCSLG